MPVTFSPASDFTLAELADIFNKGYEAYFTNFNFDAERIRGHIENHDLVLPASRVARDEQGNPVGIAFLGKRGQRGWVGGVGIYLPERGKGIGKLLMQNLIESARGEGVRDLYLEVITKNTNAHALYQKLGFQQFRRLLVLQFNELTPVDVAAEAITPMTLDEALKLREQWQTAANSWQYAPETLRKIPELEGIVLHHQAYVLFKRFSGTPERVQLFDLAMQPNQGAVLKQLISHLRKSHPDANIHMVNLPEDNAEWAALQSIGAKETLSQYEMLLQT